MRLLILFKLALITGCATGQKSSDLDYSVKHIQSAIAQKMPGGVVAVSVNRRELKSGYFKPDIYYSRIRDKKVYRSKLHVTVLGGYRPYKLLVKTSTQVRVHGGKPKAKVFSASDLTQGVWKTIEVPGLDRALMLWLVDHVTKTSKNNNLIDDFHPF